MKKIILLALVGAVLFLPSRVAQAHAVVYVCAPRIGSTLAKPPSQIVCIFDGPLSNSEVTMTVLAPSGERVDKNDAHPFEGDAHSYAVSLDPDKMGDGIYQLNWFVYDKTDDTKTSGSVQFGVNTIVPPTPTVLVPGQVIVTPSSSQAAPANSGASDLVSRFLIGLGVVLMGAMGFLYWRTRKQNKDAE